VSNSLCELTKVPVYDYMVAYMGLFSPKVKIRTVVIANNFIEHVYAGRTRKNGKPVTTHLYGVRDILIEAGIRDESVLNAALLHDILEDTDLDLEILAVKFGEKTANLVKLLSKNPFWKTSFCRMKSFMDELEIYCVDYPEALLIKLADRLHNLYTIDGFKLDKQRDYVRETMEILMPVFYRTVRNNNLGEYKKATMEILSMIRHEIESINEKLEGLKAVSKEINVLRDDDMKSQGGLSVMKYEGIDGIRKAYLEVLEEAKLMGQPIWAIERGKDVDVIGSRFIDDYVSNRVKNGIKANIIISDSPIDRKFKKENEGPFTSIKLIPDFLIEANINVVGNLVMSFSLSPMQGTLKRDIAEANTMRSVFNWLWQ
jgi:hypothetical protein